AVSGTGVVLPSLMDVDGATVLRLGVVGNVFVGALAAVVSFGLYGPLSTRPLLSAGAAGVPAAPLVLPPGACVGALLVGFPGRRVWDARRRRPHRGGGPAAHPRGPDGDGPGSGAPRQQPAQVCAGRLPHQGVNLRPVQETRPGVARIRSDSRASRGV